MELHIAQADIATIAVDAVVLPCNSMGNLNESIRKQLRDCGGEAIQDELKTKAPLAIGAAMLTSAGSLGAPIAILVPIIKHAGDEVATELLRRAIKAALIAANMKQYARIAVPCMVRQEAGPTMSEAARAVVQEIQGHILPFPEKLYLVDGDPAMMRIFEEAIEHAQHAL